jgi:hypothetical protein
MYRYRPVLDLVIVAMPRKSPCISFGAESAGTISVAFSLGHWCVSGSSFAFPVSSSFFVVIDHKKMCQLFSVHCEEKEMFWSLTVYNLRRHHQWLKETSTDLRRRACFS